MEVKPIRSRNPQFTAGQRWRHEVVQISSVVSWSPSALPAHFKSLQPATLAVCFNGRHFTRTCSGTLYGSWLTQRSRQRSILHTTKLSDPGIWLSSL